MKLITANIVGFGKYKNKIINFSDEIFEIYALNGSGKSTIAAFIKAMFYGLKTSVYREGNFDDRMHFYPFSDGNFGGNLSFESEGDRFIVERKFDVKSATKDYVRVYKNDKHAPEYEENLGEKIFGFDVETFSRLLFINHNMIDISTTSDINKKINNEVNDIDETFDMKKALYRLKKGTPDKKEVVAIKEEIEKSKEKLNNLNFIASKLKEKYTKQAILINKINEQEKLLKEANVKNDILKDFEILEGKENELAIEKERFNNYKKIYSHGYPSISELDEIKLLLNKKRDIESSINRNELSEEEKRRFNALDEIFVSSPLSDEELNNIGEEVERCTLLEKDLSNYKEDDMPLKYLKFKYQKISEDELNDLNDNIDKYKSEIEKFNGISNGEIKQNNKNHKLFLFLLLFSLIILGLGVGLIFVNKIVGIILTIIGSIGALLTLFFYIYKTSHQEFISNDDKLKFKSDVLEPRIKKIDTTLAKYGYYDDNVLIAHANFLSDLESFKEFELKFEKEKSKLDELKQEYENLKKTLQILFARYNIHYDSLSKSYFELSKNKSTYLDLKNKLTNFEKNKVDLVGKLSEISEQIQIFKDKYALEFRLETLIQYSVDISNIDSLKSRITNKENEINEFKKSKNLINKPNETIIDSALVSDVLADLRNEKSIVDKQINDDENEISEIEDIENKIEELSEKKSSLARKIKINNLVSDCLDEAMKYQKDKFAAPVKDRFLIYSTIIQEVMGKTILMDEDYRITYEKNGRQRSVKHLSSGELSILALCFRLALLDNMYESNIPFIIMDDPFVNLDDEYMEQVKELILKIAKTHQIIYLTCSKYRTVL